MPTLSKYPSLMEVLTCLCKPGSWFLMLPVSKSSFSILRCSHFPIEYSTEFGMRKDIGSFSLKLFLDIFLDLLTSLFAWPKLPGYCGQERWRDFFHHAKSRKISWILFVLYSLFFSGWKYFYQKSIIWSLFLFSSRGDSVTSSFILSLFGVIKKIKK